MKNCPYCGQLNPEENQFCNKCGKDMVNITQTVKTNSAQQAYTSMPQAGAIQAPIQQAYIPTMAQPAKKKIHWWAILGLLSGVSSSGFGIFVLNKPTYVYMSQHSYGADFYTQTSEQLRDIGHYLENISEILSTGLGCLLIALGMFMIWHFVGKLIEK